MSAGYDPLQTVLQDLREVALLRYARLLGLALGREASRQLLAMHGFAGAAERVRSAARWPRPLRQVILALLVRRSRP